MEHFAHIVHALILVDFIALPEVDDLNSCGITNGCSQTQKKLEARMLPAQIGAAISVEPALSGNHAPLAVLAQIAGLSDKAQERAETDQISEIIPMIGLQEQRQSISEGPP